jgi:hypothetical protein
MAYDYNGFVTALASNIVISTTNADFLVQLPYFIDHAELRIYRDLDLLSTVVRDPNGVIVAGQRRVTLPTTYGRFVVVEGVNLYVSTERVSALVPVSREFLDALYPSETALSLTAIPTVFCRDTDTTILVGPTAGAGSGATALEIVGTIRPTTLSAVNTTTFISQYLPDLFMAAAMVQAAGWMKNYGAQADDPRQAMAWDTVYGELLPGAKTEENRKKFMSNSWTAKSTPSSQPERV